MEISGKVFQIIEVNNFVVKLVIQKRVSGKQTPIALDALGHHRDEVLKLGLKKGDKIWGRVQLKSKLHNGRYYTDVTIKDVQLLQPKPKKPKQSDPNQGEMPFLDEKELPPLEEKHIIDPETGEVLL